jgi:outer membrane protein assembly factor BamB
VLLLFSAVLVSVAGAGAEAQGAAVYGASAGDARRTGRSSARAPLEKPKVVWTVRLSEKGLVPPAVLADGTLLVGSRGGLHALDPKTGSERWFARIGAVRFTPAVTAKGDVVVIGGDRAYVIRAQHVATGRVRELHKGLRFARVAPMLEGERAVLVGAREQHDGLLYVLELDGALRSAAALGLERPRFLAQLAPGLAIAAGHDRRVSRVPTQGFGARAIEIGDAVDGLVVGDGGEAFVVTDLGQRMVLEPSGERRARPLEERRSITASPALGHDGALRLGLEGGELLCVGPDGAERWRRGIDGRPSALLIDRDDTALLVTARGTLYAIDREGTLRWLTSAGAVRAPRPVLGADGTLYILSRGGYIAAWR